MWFIVVFELVVVIVVLAISVTMLRKNVASNLIGIALRVGGFLSSCLLAVYFYNVSDPFFGNLLIRLLLSIALSSILVAGVSVLLRRQAAKGEWDRRMQRLMRMPVWCDRLFSVVLVLGLWLIVLTSAVFAAELLSISPQGHSALKQSIAMRFLTDEDQKVSPMTDSLEVDDRQLFEQRASIDRLATEQAEFFKRISRGVRRTKQQVFTATGLDAVQREINVARRIVNLPDDDKIWLLSHHIQLAELIDHPLMRRILDDQELVKRFERFGAGRVHEVLLIGADSNVNSLLQDAEISRLVKQIDLEELLRQCEQRCIE